VADTGCRLGHALLIVLTPVDGRAFVALKCERCQAVLGGPWPSRKAREWAALEAHGDGVGLTPAGVDRADLAAKLEGAADYADECNGPAPA
jgi:hypothetical protein